MKLFNYLNEDRFIEKLLQTAAIGILTFGVSYLRNIGLETAQLNISLVQLKYEIRSLSDNQHNVNKALMEKLDSHEHRLQNIERKARR